tara:strand:- start:10817 stop:11095 length:279 start_codon:yes stop_codon:yes gene_type:complete
MATITYKGEKKEVTVDNRAIMQFEMNGGNISEFDKKPISSAVSLACACLGLTGDPLEHANDLLPMAELAEEIKVCMEQSGLSGDDDPKKENG